MAFVLTLLYKMAQSSSHMHPARLGRRLAAALAHRHQRGHLNVLLSLMLSIELQTIVSLI